MQRISLILTFVLIPICHLKCLSKPLWQNDVTILIIKQNNWKGPHQPDSSNFNLKTSKNDTLTIKGSLADRMNKTILQLKDTVFLEPGELYEFWYEFKIILYNSSGTKIFYAQPSMLLLISEDGKKYYTDSQESIKNLMLDFFKYSY